MKRKMSSAVVALSLVLAGVSPLRAEETSQPVSLRVAAERAAAKVVVPALSDVERQKLEDRAHALRTDPVAGQAGGGGMAKMLVFTLLTTAISVGTYYLFIKQTKDLTKTESAR